MEEKPASNPRKSGAKKRRPGAPKGNMNALKHGRTSRQLAELGAILAMDPTIRQEILLMGLKLGAPRRRAEDTAALLLTTFLTRAGQLSAGNLNSNLTRDELNSILEAAVRADPSRFNHPKKSRKNSKNKPSPDTPARNQ